MKKVLGLLLLLMVLAVSSAYATPTLSTNGNNEIFYSNAENVFTYNATEDRYEQLVYDTDPTVVTPSIQVGDIFVGMLKVQNIEALGTDVWSQTPGVDELSGVFAQEIMAIDLINGGVGGIQITLGISSTNEFYVDGATIDLGLDLAAGEMIQFYADPGNSQYNSGSNLTMTQSIATAMDGDEYFSVGFDDTDDYAYTNATPQTTNLNGFYGESFMGLSFITTSWPNPTDDAVNDPIEVQVGSDVDFYANSEITANPGYLLGAEYSPWTFQSNDPAVIGPVPEPGTFILFGSALLGFSAVLRRKKTA